MVPWLLRPYRWRDLFDPRFPSQLRALLASLAVMPLGGLAVPLWIFLRHRWWPRAEVAWREIYKPVRSMS